MRDKPWSLHNQHGGAFGMIVLQRQCYGQFAVTAIRKKSLWALGPQNIQRINITPTFNINTPVLQELGTGREQESGAGRLAVFANVVEWGAAMAIQGIGRRAACQQLHHHTGVTRVAGNVQEALWVDES